MGSQSAPETGGVSPAPSVGRLSIGQVLERLREDFPDVSITKIRFLEGEGLVEPMRAPSGYRRFSEGDVDRLRYVLATQRDQYLPLRVIREHLDAMDRGFEPPAAVGGPRLPAALADPGAGAAPVGLPAGEPSQPPFSPAAAVRLTRAELLAEAGIDESSLAELEEYGLVARRAGASPYDGDSLVVARLCGQLGGFGLQPRHLRTLRTAADREAGMVEQVVSPLLHARSADARSRAEERAREIAGLTIRLHASLVRTAVARLTAP